MKTSTHPNSGRRTALLALLTAAWPTTQAQAGDALYRAEASWMDDRGHPFDLSKLQGGWTLMTMAYGACRRICSTSLRLMQQAQQMADSRHQVLNFVVIGLDASQDTPADWAEFRAEHRLERANWAFLTGDANATRQMAGRLGVRYWRYGDHTMHDFRIVLLSPKGDIARAMEAFDQPVSVLLPDA